MQVNVKKFLEESGITEPFYPGKRLVHSLRQEGEYKSHCVVLDWRDPDKIKIEIKAGLSGRDLEPKRLKYYPVCFQAPTYVDIEIINDNDSDTKSNGSDEEESESGSKGKSGSGGKQPAKKKLAIGNAFSEVLEGKIPEIGKVIEMVVLGKEIAEEAYAKVLGTLSQQIEHTKIATTDLLAKASDLVTKYQPPSFMAPKGDETEGYKYDREKNADIGFRQTLS